MRALRSSKTSISPRSFVAVTRMTALSVSEVLGAEIIVAATFKVFVAVHRAEPLHDRLGGVEVGFERGFQTLPLVFGQRDGRANPQLGDLKGQCCSSPNMKMLCHTGAARRQKRFIPLSDNSLLLCKRLCAEIPGRTMILKMRGQRAQMTI